MKMPKVTIIGQNHLFPWKLGDEPICEQFERMPEKLHKIVLDEVQYIMQINSTQIHGLLRYQQFRHWTSCIQIDL